MKNIYLLIGLILSFSITGFGQEAERIIDFPSIQPPVNIAKVEDGKVVPTDSKGVELVGISVEGKTVTPGKPFAAGEDWLKTLTVKLKNVSGKTISSVRMSFARPEAKYNDAMTGFSLAFGSLSPMFDERATNKSIEPGEEFELSQTEKQYLAGKNFTINRTGVFNITKIIIGLTTVKFKDGELWTARKIPSAE